MLGKGKEKKKHVRGNRFIISLWSTGTGLRCKGFSEPQSKTVLDSSMQPRESPMVGSGSPAGGCRGSGDSPASALSPLAGLRAQVRLQPAGSTHVRCCEAQVLQAQPLANPRTSLYRQGMQRVPKPVKGDRLGM